MNIWPQTGLGHLIEKINPEYHIAGYADNGCDGMVLVKEVKPDIVITDIKMPRMNGLEMIESLRKIHMDCLFVILSGYAEFSYAQQGISLGVTDLSVEAGDCAEDQRFDGAAGEKTEACLPGGQKRRRRFILFLSQR
mgnify:CR=1 FL=1